MDGNGNHHVKQSKPDSEKQRLHVSSHMWKIDPKDKHHHLYNMSLIVRLFEGTREGKERK
jgi:hypothetical protein